MSDKDKDNPFEELQKQLQQMLRSGQVPGNMGFGAQAGAGEAPGRAVSAA